MAVTLQKRNEMVERRIGLLSGLNDFELAQVIFDYFKNNHTLPGEKWVKDTANQMLSEFTEDSVTMLMPDVRKQLIEAFANICVKSMPIRFVEVVNDTKKNRGSKLRKATDLPMTISEVIPVAMKENTVVRNIYEMPASLNIMEKSIYVKDAKDHNILAFYLGRITKGFYKNHFSNAPMDCTVIATDHSNGKFANMSYRMLVDLCPAL